MGELVAEFLPQTKYQLIGFAILVASQLLSEFFLGLRAKEKQGPGSILELIFTIFGVTMIALVSFIFYRGKNDESDSTKSPH